MKLYMQTTFDMLISYTRALQQNSMEVNRDKRSSFYGNYPGNL